MIEMGDAVAFAPGGSGLAVACRDHGIRLLELPSRRVLATFPCLWDYTHSMAFSPDGTTLFAVGGSGDGSDLLRRWDVATHQTLPAMPWIDQASSKLVRSITPTAVAASPDGRAIAVSGGGSLPAGGTSAGLGGPSLGKPPVEIGVVRLLNTRTGALNWEYTATGGWVSSVDFSPDGKMLACANGPVLLLDARTGALKTTLKPVTGYVLAAAFSPDGKTLAGAGSNTVAAGWFGGLGRVTLWDVETGKILRTLNGPTGRAQKVAFSPDGRTVAAAGSGPMKEGRDSWFGTYGTRPASEVRLWEVATGKMIWTTEGEIEAAFSMAISPDGQWLAFCDRDYVYLLDARTGKLKQIVMETVLRVRPAEPHTHKGRVPKGRP